MNKAITLLLLAVILTASTAKAEDKNKRWRVVAYNVENFYDTIPSNIHDDTQFLPSSEREWNGRRYWYKQGLLARTLANLGETAPPALVALCEIESERVLEDLTRHTSLKKFGYEYLATHSEDTRGMNVALLYRPLSFRPYNHKSIRTSPPQKELRQTRDVLHVSGELPTGDTLDVFVCHAPSRMGGKSVTSNYRELVAKSIYDRIKMLSIIRQNLYVLILGDFNDDYTEPSIKRGLGAKPYENERDTLNHQLYVLTHHLKNKDGVQGTYKFQGEWNQLDQIIVNGNLLNQKSSFHVVNNTCRIANLPYLQEVRGEGKSITPKRTFLGAHYHGGLSDHFPLVVDFTY
ncbi:MAG: endonuclease [Bacteroidaceae bacterium]|nr:endonuclease [Bacteroidaceae bacterium]